MIWPPIGPSRRYTAVRTGVALAAIAAVVVAAKAGMFDIGDLATLRSVIGRVQGLSGIKLMFVVGYAVLSAVGVPSSPLTLAGGALFGVWWGIPLNWLGAFSGSMLGFLGTWVLAGRRGMCESANSIIETPRAQIGPLMLFRLRVVPIVPFSLLNVASALSGMPLSAFALATGAGLVPIVVIYTAIASSVVSGVEGSGARGLILALLVAAGIIALTLAPRLSDRRRKVVSINE